MWKKVTVQYNGETYGPYSDNFKEVAGVREDSKWLVIRTGAYPNETIHKIALCKIALYIVENVVK